MSVLVTLKFPVKASQVDNLLRVLKEALVDTRAYDGCQSVSFTWSAAHDQYIWWSTGIVPSIKRTICGGESLPV